MPSHTTDEIRMKPAPRRQTSQSPLPVSLPNDFENLRSYRIFPYHALPGECIYNGYTSLAAELVKHPTIILDGYIGVFWQDVAAGLAKAFEELSVRATWINAADFLKPSTEIDNLIKPYLEPAGSIWGKRCDLTLSDFFNVEALKSITRDPDFEINIIYGCGASLVDWKDCFVVYFDVPKNEIQYRMRAGAVSNLGMNAPGTPAYMYKRFYFVDWIVLNQHKKTMLSKTDIVIDAQRQDTITWIRSDKLIEGLQQLSRSLFRVRPWFEAGAWGGQWMKEHLYGLNKEEVNYAWSFELIVTENGIVFGNQGLLLEVSFDFLMYTSGAAVLGKHADIFGDEFPIRFDFLDTWQGGNLSIQCHPTLPYMRKTFGEHLTQDETYYILDRKDDATVYLGFQENIDPVEFRTALEASQRDNKVLDVEKYVQRFEAEKHALYLIPGGTVHSAGANNLVLEISATPYIFTFKMYDWLRLDLNGKPRPINIEHAFHNLAFDRKGAKVADELISKPVVIESGNDWQLVHLPTHPNHFYDVHRIEFDNEVLIHTNDSCHILMLVEGSSIRVHTADGAEHIFYYAETFVIPAAAKAYRISNQGEGRAKVVKAFIKDNVDFIK